jgi:hypothetical protein
MNKTKLASLIDETIDSMNGAERAEPAPYLLTRLNARMNRQSPTAWERISWFLARPGIAFATFACILIVNILIYNYDNGSADTGVNTQASAEDYSMNNSTALFDLENIQQP